MSDDKIPRRIGVTYFLEGDGIERIESTQMILVSELEASRFPINLLDQMVKTAFGEFLRKRERQNAATRIEDIADAMGKVLGRA